MSPPRGALYWSKKAQSVFVNIVRVFGNQINSGGRRDAQYPTFSMQKL